VTSSAFPVALRETLIFVKNTRIFSYLKLPPVAVEEFSFPAKTGCDSFNSHPF